MGFTPVRGTKLTYTFQNAALSVTQCLKQPVLNTALVFCAFVGRLASTPRLAAWNASAYANTDGFHSSTR